MPRILQSSRMALISACHGRLDGLSSRQDHTLHFTTMSKRGRRSTGTPDVAQNDGMIPPLATEKWEGTHFRSHIPFAQFSIDICASVGIRAPTTLCRVCEFYGQIVRLGNETLNEISEGLLWITASRHEFALPSSLWRGLFHERRCRLFLRAFSI
jgi:hypothetical protein